MSAPRLDPRLWIEVGIGLAIAPFVAAQPLPDPTQPPASVRAPSAAVPTPAPKVATAWELQSVLRGRGRTPAALISGELVPLGGSIGAAKLLRLSESSAWLQTPTGEIRLELTPAAEKKDGVELSPNLPITLLAPLAPTSPKRSRAEKQP